MRTLQTLGLACWVVACGGGSEYHAQTPSTMSGPSSYGSSFSQPSVPVSDSMSHTATSGVEVIAKPDELDVEFVVHHKDGQNVKAIHTIVDEWSRALTGRLGQPVRVKMQAITFSQSDRTWKSEGSSSNFELRVQGCFEVTLSRDVDYWARSAMLAEIAKVRFEELAKSTEKRETWVMFQPPVLRVRDVEPYRDALTKQWTERSRVLAVASTGDQAARPNFSDCEPPGDIHQHVKGPDIAVLTLPLRCKLNAQSTQK